MGNFEHLLLWQFHLIKNGSFKTGIILFFQTEKTKDIPVFP